MLKITHIINGLDIGGAETNLARLVETLDRDKFNVDVISLTDAGPLAERIRNAGIPVRALGLNTRVPNPLLFLKLRAWLKTSAPDIVQTWMYHSNLIGGLAAKSAGVRNILWGIRQTNVDDRSIPRATQLVAKAGAHLSRLLPTLIICNSDVSKAAHIALGYDASRFQTIPNGFDLALFRPDQAARASLRTEIGVGEETLIVGLVARFDRQKDHETLVRAAAQLFERHSDVHFVLCGKGIDRENLQLAGWIDGLGQRNQFHLLGQREDIARLTAGFDIAVSSSLGEGFANNIGEAMSCAIPCVATDVGESKIVVGDTGFIVPPSSPPALADALGRMIDEGPGGRQRRGLAARARIQEHYTLTGMTQRFSEVYTDLRPSN